MNSVQWWQCGYLWPDKNELFVNVWIGPTIPVFEGYSRQGESHLALLISLSAAHANKTIATRAFTFATWCCSIVLVVESYLLDVLTNGAFFSWSAGHDRQAKSCGANGCKEVKGSCWKTVALTNTGKTMELITVEKSLTTSAGVPGCWKGEWL